MPEMGREVGPKSSPNSGDQDQKVKDDSNDVENKEEDNEDRKDRDKVGGNDDNVDEDDDREDNDDAEEDDADDGDVDDEEYGRYTLTNSSLFIAFIDVPSGILLFCHVPNSDSRPVVYRRFSFAPVFKGKPLFEYCYHVQK